MELLQIDAVSAILIVGATMGAVELIKALFDKNWRTAVTILGAGVAGCIAGILTGYTPLIGVVAGLAASGTITLGKSIASV